MNSEIDEIALIIWAGSHCADPLFDEEKSIKAMRRKLKTGSLLHRADIAPHRRTAEKIMHKLRTLGGIS